MKGRGKGGNDAAKKAMMGMLKGGGNMGGNMAQLMKVLMSQMGAGGLDTDVNPKQLLMQTHSKTLGKSIKLGEEISFGTSQVEGDSKKVQYQSQVTVGDQVFAGHCAASKKEAEQNAAKTALDELYPGVHTAASATKKGTKRKSSSIEDMPIKTQLSRLVSFTKNASCAKDDISVTVDGSAGAFTATVSIPLLNVTFTGTGTGRKTAEAAALEATVQDQTMKQLLETCETQLAARKKAKGEASMAKFKEKYPDKFEKKAAA